MPRSFARIRALLIASREATRAAFKAAESADIEACLHPLRRPASAAEVASVFEVVMIDVDAARDLQLVSELCARPGSAAVVALASRGFAGKSLEYVLVMAEIRGASATLAGDVDTLEFRDAILESSRRLRFAAGQGRRIA
jgi:hypothetical protein